VNRIEHLLTCLSEECAEVAQGVSKALRFGLDDKGPDAALTNRDSIVAEVIDLLAVLSLLEDEGVFVQPEDSNKRILLKRAKVLKWMAHAKERGTLTDDGGEQ
jgi:hypothetical protein